MSDRLGRKALIICGWLTYGAVYVGFAALDTAPALVLCFLAYGIYFGLAEGTEKALVADLTPPGRQGTAFGWYHATLGVGTLLASVVFGVVYEQYGAPVAFGMGALLAVTAAGVLSLLPITRTIPARP